MEKNLSHHHHSRNHSLPKKPHNGNGVYTSVKTSNTVTTTTTYDDVFGGPPRFGPPTLSPRLEDYCEIFSGFNGSSRAAVSSIPILDLPLDKGLSFDVRRESFDYREVFGGFDGLDSAPSYDELFVQRDTVADGDSSDGAWTPEEEEEVEEEKSPSFSNGRDSFDSIEFNISYHKANQVNNGTSVSRVAPDLGCTVAVDEMVGGSGRGRGKVDKETGPSSSVAAFEDKNGDQKYHSGATTSCLSEPFVTVSEIGLKTHPTGIPPPSRPPPVLLKSDFRRSGSNSRTTGSEGSSCSPPFFDVEVDASSAAVREAMVKAEAKLKSAKEMFEKKQTSMNGRMSEEGKSSHAAGLDHKSLSSQGSGNSDGNEEWEEATQFVELVRTEQPRNADENSGGEDVRSAGFFDQKLTWPANADWEKQQRRAKGDREEDHEAKKLPKHPGARKVASRHKRREDRVVEKAPEKLRDVQLQFEIGNNISDHGSGIVKQRNLIRPEESKHLTEKLSKQKMADRRAAEKNLDNVFDWEQNARKLREALGLSDNESTLEVPLGTRGEMDESEAKLKEALRRMEEETSSKEASLKEETEAFEKAENEKRLKSALEQEEKLKKLKEENERREAEAREKAEQERRRKEQEEYELRLKEAFEKEEENRRMREAREKAAKEERRMKEQEEYERRLKEAFEKEEKNRIMREAREKAEAENERKMKEAREKEENERRRIKEAHEKAEVERRMKETLEREEKERQIKELQERRAKEALEQAENERKLKEAREKEENEKKLKEAIELEEKEKRLIEAFERAETERRLKEELEQEDMRLQEAKEREERERTQRENQDRQEKERDERQEDTCEMEKTCETTSEALEEDERVDNHEPVNKVIVEEEEEGPSSVSEEACHWKVFEKNLKDASQKEGTNELDTESEKLNGEESGEETSPFVTEGNLNQKSKTVEERSEDEKLVKNASVGGAKLERPLPSQVFMQREKEAERLKRELDTKMENLRKIEEEREREREREKDRMAFDQRALADARERLEKACAEARERSFPSTEARLRAERAAVERATAEARERAAEKAAFEARDRMERSVSDKQLGSFGERTEKQFQNSASFGASRYQNSPGADGESPQRYTSRLERHRRTADRVAKALAEKNMRDLVAQREQAERVRIAETLDAEVKRWSSGKEGNIRALLSTLQYILGSESGWQPLPLTEVITSAAVKRAYRKATLCVHPDKLQQRGANIHQKYICEKVFDLLKEAWNRFNSEER
ncbi:auxilin-related protein 1-like [Brassica napus]|uniref:auxilin-related protein 1-like n=1 Tax=Brassica napus TaxID=3708 RepID=UPI002078CA37|nr:auxilin-related protein 1-like [Brassica napus]